MSGIQSCLRWSRSGREELCIQPTTITCSVQCIPATPNNRCGCVHLNRQYDIKSTNRTSLMENITFELPTESYRGSSCVGFIALSTINNVPAFLSTINEVPASDSPITQFEVIVEATILSLSALCGSGGNLLVFYMVQIIIQVHKGSALLISNLPVTDFNMFIFNIPIQVYGILYPPWSLTDGLCHLIGLLDGIFTFISLNSYVAIAASCYLSGTCLWNIYRNLVTSRISLLFVLSM